MRTSTFFPISFLWTLLLGAGFLLAPVQATAQTPTLVGHLRTALQSEDALRQQMALVDINALAHCTATCTVGLQSVPAQKIRIENETGTGGIVDLNGLVPDLLKSYRSGPADGHRLLALSALLQIGDENALEQLIEESSSQSDKMSRKTQQHLAGFYLEKYPELTERVQRSGRLTLDDVTRAKALRVKAEKKEADKKRKN